MGQSKDDYKVFSEFKLPKLIALQHEHNIKKKNYHNTLYEKIINKSKEDPANITSYLKTLI